MNILLIDNDPIFLKFAKNFLIGEGHTVLNAHDGLSALDALKSFSPDLFFIDYVMPNIDGKAFCQLLRKNPRYKSAFIVLLSAIAAEEWADLKNIGADACIAKGPLSKMKGHLTQVLADPVQAANTARGRQAARAPRTFPRRIAPLDGAAPSATAATTPGCGPLPLPRHGRPERRPRADPSLRQGPSAVRPGPSGHGGAAQGPQ